MQSDFKPIQNSEQLIGLFEYFGSTAVLWLGCILWWTPTPKGQVRQPYNEFTMVFLMILVLSLFLAILMSLISINAMVGVSSS